MKLTRYILMLCLLLSLGGWGCRAKAVETPQAEPTSTPEVVASVETEPDPSAVNAGLPVQDISDKVAAGDSPDRKALLAVAHAATGIPDSEPFYVWQLYAQGSSAVGDLQGSTSGNRLLVAFENDGSGWKAVYQKKFIDASEAELVASCPMVTDELAQRVDFVVPIEIDDFYVQERGILESASAQMDSYNPGSMYAPTRLPEDFAVVGTRSISEGASSVEYARGDARLTYFAWMSGDYGDQPTPDDIYTSLRFGDLPASMDSAFYYRTDGPEQGPFLTARGHHVVCAVGIMPGMVAAVAESMVRVK